MDIEFLPHTWLPEQAMCFLFFTGCEPSLLACFCNLQYFPPSGFNGLIKSLRNGGSQIHLFKYPSRFSGRKIEKNVKTQSSSFIPCFPVG